MVNPTIEEVGHYRPDQGKCPICREWWGLHSIEEENDHGMKILDWLEKKEIAQKIFENAALSDFFKLMLNPKMVRELSERKNKLSSQLTNLDQQPQAQAEKKGQISEGLRISEKEKIENESIIEETDKRITRTTWKKSNWFSSIFKVQNR